MLPRNPALLLLHCTKLPLWVMMRAMNRIVRSKPKPLRFSGPPRARHEPPTLDEAVSAAQDLADSLEQQVAIVAGLLGLSEDQVREKVLSASPKRASARMPQDILQTARSPRVVVVRRRKLGP